MMKTALSVGAVPVRKLLLQEQMAYVTTMSQSVVDAWRYNQRRAIMGLPNWFPPPAFEKP